ncbi:MAG: hemophore-related protein [Mycolicibacterium sp.]|nr:hemophore-related protein [Mycobacterium sp.]MCB9442238.1 hemophore-related protein [Mycolicibacterium sp.]
MTRLSLAGMVAAAGALLALLLPGVASAEPDYSALINTDCSYDQVISAVRVQNPAAAAFLDSRPDQQDAFRTYFAQSRESRANIIEKNKTNPAAQQILDVAQGAVAACHSY